MPRFSTTIAQRLAVGALLLGIVANLLHGQFATALLCAIILALALLA